MEKKEHLDTTHKKREEQAMRHQIADAYLELLKTKTADEISVTEIARAAGVSRMAFYRKFEDKTSIVDFYLGGILHWEVAYNEATGEDYDIWSEPFGVRFFKAMKRYREQILLLAKRGYSDLILRVINLTNECAGGDMPTSSIERYNLYFLAGAGFNAMLIWLKNGCVESPDEMARALAKYMRLDSGK